jgi:AcrR family transcriptional regulator
MEAARSVFEEQGYERASMSQISERLGGSKATLYGYFPSKEELFVAVMEDANVADAAAMLDQLRLEPDLRVALSELGRQYLLRALGGRPSIMRRMLASLPPDNDLGLQFYERGIRQPWMKISIYFTELMLEGKLRRANAWIAAMHFKGLLEAEFVEMRTLHAMRAPPDAPTIERVVADGVDIFLRAYGPES